MNLGTPCIHWDGYVYPGKGYGRCTHEGQKCLAHRVAYEREIGPIPKGYVIDHGCHNADIGCQGGPTCLHRRCVNTEHLEAITLAENNRRGRVNATKTHCKNDHPFNEANTYMDPRGLRQCRACDAARHRARNRKTQAAATAA